MDEINITAAEALAAVASSAATAASAQAALAKTAVALRAALKNMIAGFDELHVVSLQKETAATAAKGSTRKGSASSSKKKATEEKSPIGKGGRDISEIQAAADEAMGLREQLLAMLNDVAAMAAAAVAPVGVALQTVVQGIRDGITNVWEQFGPEITQRISNIITGVGDLFRAFFDTMFTPVLANIAENITWLWEQHLAPLWENLLGLFAAVGNLLLAAWETVLLPFSTLIVEIFGPAITAVVNFIGDTFATVLGVITDIISAVIGVMQGLITFLTGIFTLNWTKMWQGAVKVFSSVFGGIVDILKGIMNVVIDIINGALGGIAAAINAVVGAVNSLHVTVPAWVPGFGGKTFGFSLGTVTAPQIPKLAQGAVIPPNASFLAVLGDQKNGRNLETPEALLRQIVREESGTVQGDMVTAPVVLQLDGEVLLAAMEKVRLQRGAEVGGAFAYAQ